MSTVHTENLFRRQAIQALAEKPLGRPICLMPRPWLWLMSLIGVTFIAALLFVVTTEYTRKETVRGWLISKPGVVRVAHNASAQVTRVLQQPGDVIKKGQPLLYLSTDASLSDGGSKNVAVLAQIHDAIAELQLQQDLLAERKNLDLASLTRQIETIDAEEKLLHAEIGEARTHVALAEEKQLKLAVLRTQGATTEWDVLRQKEEVGVLRQALSRLHQNEMSLQREREQLASRLATLPVEVQARISALRSEGLRMSQEVAEYESRRSTVVTSPIDGTIVSVATHAGGSTGPQQTLVTLLPLDWQLAAEFYVPSRAAGFLHRGQTVRLDYDAFPQQKFGMFAGKIDFVSDFVLLPAEVPQTFSLREATYRVRVEIGDAAIVTAFGSARLRPGMLLAAEIVLEKRNLIDWLLEPLRLTRRDTA